MSKLFLIVIIVLAGSYLFFTNWSNRQPAVSLSPTLPVSPSASLSPTTGVPASDFTAPLARARERVTKKPFGIFVSPSHSPVKPERFIGYHTGVDFETFADEQDTDVVISAICDGTLVLKKWATGYGGVAVQSCQYNGQPIAVIYGHLRLSSITVSQGSRLTKGERLAVLGRGYSPDTDGERKHLHLGIHLGSVINIAGYAARRSDLKNWLDFAKLMPQ